MYKVFSHNFSQIKGLKVLQAAMKGNEWILSQGKYWQVKNVHLAAHQLQWMNQLDFGLSDLAWGHIHKAPKGKTEAKGKLWHWITTKPENITQLYYYDRLQIQFCISLTQVVFKLSKKQTVWELKDIWLFLVFHLRCSMNMGPGTPICTPFPIHFSKLQYQGNPRAAIKA